MNVFSRRLSFVFWSFAAIALPLSAEEARADAEWSVSVATTFPSGVAFVGEQGSYVVTVTNTSGRAADATLRLLGRTPGDANELRREWPVKLGAGETGSYAWEASTETPGYLALIANVSATNGDGISGGTTSALLVVPRADAGRLPPERSFFGTMFIRDAEAAARIGVRVERRQAVWEWLQPKGPGLWEWEGTDRSIRDRAEHGIGTVLTIRPEMHPRWTRWKSVEELAGPEHLPEFTAFVREVVARYKDRVLAIEIMNEPDLEVARHATGKITPAEAYARILKAGYEASKSVAPDLPVIGLDVSGVDFPRLQFSRDVLPRGSGYMDIFGGHPYNHSRYVGGDALPESPIKMDAAGRMRSMAELMKAHGLPPRVWSTEFGWALHLDEPLSSPAARLFAAYTAQAILLSRSVPEVEKLFWFAATFPGRERASSYGMFRKSDERTNYHRVDGNWYPSPSAAAYATCARLLDDVTFVRSFMIGPFVHVLRFSGGSTGDEVLALWMDDASLVGGGAKLRLPASAPRDGRMVDAFGREAALASAFELEPSPVFVVVPSTSADRFEKALRDANVEARERLVVQGAHVSRLDQLSVEIINNDLRPAPVKVFVAGQGRSARSRLVDPGVTRMTVLAEGLALDAPGQTTVRVLDERTSAVVTTELRHHLRSLPRIASTEGSWEAELARVARPLELAQRDQVLPADPGVDWKGAADLSLTAWAGWTPEGVALVVRVRDDVHVGPPAGATNVWSFDSLQVAFDMGNRAGHGYDEHCREYSVALDEAGAPVLVDDGGGKVADSSVQPRIRREGGFTRYEILFPWSRLGGAPLSEGDAFRMNFIVNDRDGATRKCWIGPSPGIGEAKRPAAFPQWILR